MTHTPDLTIAPISDGYRESETNWSDVLLDLKQRGLKSDPKVAIGDGIKQEQQDRDAA